MTNYENFDKIAIKEENFLKENTGDAVCRLCVEKTCEYSSIFQENLHESLILHLRMMIKDTDNWPKVVCSKCLNTARMCLNFLTTIRESESKLREIYGEWNEVELKADFEEIHIPKVNVKIETNWDPLEHEAHDSSDDSAPLDSRLLRPRKKRLPAKKKQEIVNEVNENEPKNMRRKVNVRETIRQIEEFYKMTCDTCQETFSTLRELQHHHRNDHNQLPYIMCCKTKLLRPNKMREHIEYHRNPEAFKCEECGKSFISSENRNLHKLKAHTPAEQHQYRCEKCPKTFVLQDQLRRHTYIHIPKEERQFKCQHCNKLFAMEQNLKFHIRLNHQEIPPNNLHVCEICAKSFKIKENLKRHRETHPQVESDRVPCPICKKISKNKYQLAKHMKFHSESGKMFQCDICRVVKKSSNALKSHIRYVHVRERKHKCKICDAAFKTPIGLREHTATHSSSQILYTCSFCPKQFNSNANMYVHQKRKHPEEYEAAKIRKGLSEVCL
ncbi:hypothetical protein DMENIID0001_150090 [Sergentomyia squamirostris]